MNRATTVGNATRRYWVLLYERGKSADAIAESYGVSAGAVRTELRRRGVQIRNKGTRTLDNSLPNNAQVLRCTSPRVWCAQCDRNVEHREAAVCASPWCKAKIVTDHPERVGKATA